MCRFEIKPILFFYFGKPFHIAMKNVYIHIATLSFLNSAESLRSKLKSIENINIIYSMINSKNIYKVVIGPFNNLSELIGTFGTWIIIAIVFFGDLYFFYLFL